MSISVTVCDVRLIFSDLIDMNTSARMKNVMEEPLVTDQIFSYLLNMFRPFKAITKYGRTPLIRTLVIWIAKYLYRLGSSGKFAENSTKRTCLK